MFGAPEIVCEIRLDGRPAWSEIFPLCAGLCKSIPIYLYFFPIRNLGCECFILGGSLLKLILCANHGGVLGFF